MYPGGEVDSCRPLHQPRHVEFAGRRGYVRLALDTGVPVVPLATIGAHWTFPMLPGGRWLAELLNTRRWLRSDCFPLPVAGLPVLLVVLAWMLGLAPGWAVGALAPLLVLPLPLRVTSQLLPPIDLRVATAHIEDPTERIEAAHRLVHGRLQAAVRDMQHGVPAVRKQLADGMVLAR